MNSSLRPFSRLLLLHAAAVLLLFITAFAPRRSSAQDGLALLRVETGAEVNALGGAAVALPENASALRGNPALAAMLTRSGVSFGYNSYWSSISLYDLTFAPHISPQWVGLFALNYAGLNNIEQRSIASTEPAATFGLNDVDLRVGLSRQLGTQTSIGVAAGWVMEKIDFWRGSALSADLGVVHRFTSSIMAGAAVTHLGSGFALSAPGQISSRDITQPTAVHVGLSYAKSQLLASGEVEAGKNVTVVKLGAGYALIPEFSLRAGYRFGDDSRTFSAGLVAVQNQFQLSYAVVPYRHSLGTAHLVSLGLRW